jgi:hypothetical protein
MKRQAVRSAIREALAACSVRPRMESRFLGGRVLASRRGPRAPPEALRVVSPGPRGIAPVGVRARSPGTRVGRGGVGFAACCPSQSRLCPGCHW